MSDAKRRPTSLEDLPFPRHGAVRWFSPGELVRTGQHVVLSGVFGAYADKREVQAALDVPPFHDHSAAPELWLDYVADTGDGFDATFSVAYLMSVPKLDLQAGDGTGGPAGGAVPTPRGSVLVLGGDEVYPTATAQAYEERTKGPFRAALPWSADPPALYAVPGNHDWYDGLTAWLRFFGQGQWVGGRRTTQRRSYFALRLPQGWWLLGLDIQLDSYIDGPQVEYFRAVAARIGPDDGIVLCTGKPSWVRGGHGDARAYATLDHFVTSVLTGVDPRQVRVMLSGDTHHYARYAEDGGDRQLITCGGGGAYLSATHGNPERLLLPPRALHEREVSPPEEVAYELRSVYPPADVSRRLVPRVVDRLPRRNPRFVLAMAALQVALAHLYVSGAGRAGGSLADTWAAVRGGAPALAPFRSPLLLLACAVVVVGFLGFCRSGGARRAWAGVVHAVLHIGLAVGLVHAAARLPVPETWPDAAAYAGRLVTTGLVGGALGTLVVGLYLLACARRGLHLNEVFSAQSIEDHKSFLRLHVGADGDLTVHAVAVPRACRRWRVPAADGPESPWLAPDEPLPAVLVEPPVTVPRRPRP